MIKKISIKKAKIKDIKEIGKIHLSCVKKINSKFYPPAVIQEWLNQISDENIKGQFYNSKWVVLFIDKKIAGFVQFSPETKELFQINIKPSLNGKGYGKKLYQYIETFFKKNNIREITLNATLNAVNFYKKLGFKKVKKIKFALNKQSLTMIKMIKIL